MNDPADLWNAINNRDLPELMRLLGPADVRDNPARVAPPEEPSGRLSAMEIAEYDADSLNDAAWCEERE